MCCLESVPYIWRLAPDAVRVARMQCMKLGVLQGTRNPWYDVLYTGHLGPQLWMCK